MEFFEQLLSTPAADVTRFLFAITVFAVVAAVFAVSRSMLRIVDGIMDNNKTLMQQQVITMQDISASLALHNQAATTARAQTMISLKQNRHEIRENRKILVNLDLNSNTLNSLVGDISVTERETRGKINDVIIPAIIRIETDIDGLWKSVREIRGQHEYKDRGNTTDETLNLAPMPARVSDPDHVGGDASHSSGGHNHPAGSNDGNDATG